MRRVPRQIKQQSIRDAVGAVPDMLRPDALGFAVDDDTLQSPVLDIVNRGNQRLRNPSRDQSETHRLNTGDERKHQREQHANGSECECFVNAARLLFR